MIRTILDKIIKWLGYLMSFTYYKCPKCGKKYQDKFIHYWGGVDCKKE